MDISEMGLRTAVTLLVIISFQSSADSISLCISPLTPQAAHQAMQIPLYVIVCNVE